MPFSIGDVEKHTKKATTDKLKKQWVEVANSSLDECEGDAADCDAAAIRSANGVIAKAVEESLAEFGGEMYGPPVGGATSFVDVLAGEKADQVSDVVITRTFQFQDIVRNIMRSDTDDRVAMIRSAADEYLDLVSELMGGVDEETAEEPTEPEMPADPEMPEDTVESDLCESATGHFLAITDGEIAEDAQNQARAPLIVDFALIQPGFGNRKHNHYYPAEMLRRDANVFEGVKMYATDHRPEEKSVRTEVAVIESITGFTDDGAPIGRAVVFDPDFAEATRNRAKAGQLGTLECSILAKGKIKEGKIDGRKTNIVEAITSAASVDLVTKAGAGGQALAIQESDLEDETGGEIMPEEIEETTEEAEEQTLEEADDQPAETEQETEEVEPVAVLVERVRELLAESGLPEEAQGMLIARPYENEEQVTAAIAEMRDFIKRVSGSGQPFGLGETQPTQDQPPTPEQLEERKAERFRAIMEREDPGYVANLQTVGG